MCTAAPFLRLSPHAGRGRPASIARRAGEGLPITYRPSPQPSPRKRGEGAGRAIVIRADLRTCDIAPVVERRGDAVVLFLQRCARLGPAPFAPSKTGAREVFLIRAPKKEGARNAGRGMRPQPRVHGLSLDTRVLVTTKAPASSGVPHAGVFSACFACPPVGGPLIPTVVVVRAARPPRRKALRTVPCYGARHRAGSTRLGPTREAMSVRRISAPAASHSVVVSLGAGLSRASGV